MRITLLAITALLTFACGGAAPKATAELPRVTTAQLAAWIADDSVAVVDNNDWSTYEAGHIPGATHIKYDGVTANTLPTQKKDARMAFYCTNERCGASTKAAAAAQDLGFTNVFVYKPGIEGWKAAGQETAAVEKKGPDGEG